MDARGRICRPKVVGLKEASDWHSRMLEDKKFQILGAAIWNAWEPEFVLWK